MYREKAGETSFQGSLFNTCLKDIVNRRHPLVKLAEGPGYFDILQELISRGKVRGSMIHDARIAALCLHHGVKKLWTADRDFSRFSSLKCQNPL